MRKIKIYLLFIILLSVQIFAEDVATITALKGSAIIERGVANIKASLGAKLKEKDILQTKENSKIQIIFKDETIVNVGKNSRFFIEEYLFEDSKEPVAKFGMLKGAMRAITGKIGKIAPQKFTVKTKTTTIGIRGTNFIVVLKDDNFHQAYCTYGAISVTINNKAYIVKQGFYITLLSDGKVITKEYTKKDLKSVEKNYFEILEHDKNNPLLDSKLDDEDLEMEFDESSNALIEDISETLSDMDKIIVEEDTVEQNTPTNPTNNMPVNPSTGYGP